MSKLKQKLDNKYTKISLYAIGTLVITFILCTLLSLSGGFFRRFFHIIGLVLKPFIAGGIIAYLFEPLIQRIEKMLKFKNARPVAVFGTLLIIVLLIIALLFTVFAFISNQVQEIHFDDIGTLISNFSEQLNDVWERAQQWLANHDINLGKITGGVSGFISGLTGTASDIGELAVTISVNDLASAGAEPIGILLTVLLTPRMREAKLKAIMEQVDAACKRYNVQVIGGHTEVTEAVNQPLISVTAVGKVKKGQMISTGGAKPGMDIVLTKWIGLEGTSIIAKDHEKELLERLPQSLIDTAKGFDQYLSVLPESRIAVEHGVAAMHDVTEGGIFGALWEMGEASGVGLDVDLKAIPVKQETIEVCEFFGINPYELISSGAMLIATDDGNGLVRKLRDAGVASAIIGKSNSSNDKRVINGDEERFLEPPKTDVLYNVH